MGVSAGVPVEIRGVRYPSCAAAAAAVGMSPSAIRKARAAGTLDAVGLTVGPRRGPTVAVSVSWPSVAAAARDLGVSYRTVQEAVAAGTVLDLVTRNVLRGRGRGNARAVTVHGVRYHSCAAAGRALGVSYQTVAQATALGRADTIGASRGHAQRRGVPCRWGGVTYPSFVAAARAAGITIHRLMAAIERGETALTERTK